MVNIPLTLSSTYVLVITAKARKLSPVFSCNLFARLLPMMHALVSVRFRYWPSCMIGEFSSVMALGIIPRMNTD